MIYIGKQAHYTRWQKRKEPGNGGHGERNGYVIVRDRETEDRLDDRNCANVPLLAA
jgi:hypothetical protein